MVKLALRLKASCLAKKTKTRYVPIVKLNKNRSENFLAFVSTRARSGSRPIIFRSHIIKQYERFNEYECAMFFQESLKVSTLKRRSRRPQSVIGRYFTIRPLRYERVYLPL